jgi:hypothetical protein
MVVATDGVPMFGVRVPGQPPAPAHVAVVGAEPDDERRDERQLADVRPDPGPKLVAATREDVLEIGLEPARQLG